MLMRAVFVLSLFLAGILTGCASAPAAQQRTWRDAAKECYADVEAGLGKSWYGFRGRAACDEYVRANQAEEARRAAQDSAERDAAILMMIDTLTNMGQSVYRPVPVSPPVYVAPPPEPVPYPWRGRCTSVLSGNRVYTYCPE